MGGICLTRGPQISRAALSIMMAAPTVAIMAALKKEDLPSRRLISKTWINKPDQRSGQHAEGDGQERRQTPHA